MQNDPGGAIFVTGASGFVGSAVARALLAAGRKVRVLIRPGSPKDNIAGLDLLRMQQPHDVGDIGCFQFSE